ncbi:MAG TPA: hypothetical protein VN862_11605 [Candidatus Acidoferrales bacterium]|nr:hypothetical protein [Candidatus Acidoferrales bacterium]
MTMTDEQFMASFEDASLSSDAFHHEGHVRMAFLYLSRYPALEALQRFSGSLARLAAVRGKPELYHETITWAFLLLIRERMVRAKKVQSCAEFCAANSDVLNWKENVLKKYYRDDTLASDLARRVFLLPDKAVSPHA